MPSKAYFTAQAIANYEDSNGCEGPASSSKVCSKEAKDTYLEDMFEGECKDMRSDFGPGPFGAPEYSPKYNKFNRRKYNNGESWDFQTCTNLIFLAGQGNESMFPVHLASYKELTQDCQDQFGSDIGLPRPTELNNICNFASDLALVETSVTCIVFLNGMQDMWVGRSYIKTCQTLYLP